MQIANEAAKTTENGEGKMAGRETKTPFSQQAPGSYLTLSITNICNFDFLKKKKGK